MPAVNAADVLVSSIRTPSGLGLDSDDNVRMVLLDLATRKHARSATRSANPNMSDTK